MSYSEDAQLQFTCEYIQTGKMGNPMGNPEAPSSMKHAGRDEFSV